MYRALPQENHGAGDVIVAVLLIERLENLTRDKDTTTLSRRCVMLSQFRSCAVSTLRDSVPMLCGALSVLCNAVTGRYDALRRVVDVLDGLGNQGVHFVVTEEVPHPIRCHDQTLVILRRHWIRLLGLLGLFCAVVVSNALESCLADT